VRLPNAAHESRPWHIRRVASDFTLEDVWALPVYGEAGDFPRLVQVMATLDPTATPSAASRLLFDIRFRLGRLFGWDDNRQERRIPASTDVSLARRLPSDLRDTAIGMRLGSQKLEKLGAHFTPLYITDRESAAEISNQTVHGVLHLGWVEQENGRYQGEMAIYVKPRGWMGHAYMALIKPFRYAVVYPGLMRQIERAWSARPL
jgi:hypothetical protein